MECQVYDSDGMHSGPQYFAGSDENIASFIMLNRMNATTITDPLDRLIVSSLPGGFLDHFGYSYVDRRDGIMKEILPMQYGEKEPVKIEFLE